MNGSAGWWRSQRCHTELRPWQTDGQTLSTLCIDMCIWSCTVLKYSPQRVYRRRCHQYSSFIDALELVSRDNYNFLHVSDKMSDQAESWPDMFWQSLAKASYPGFSLALRAESLGTNSLVLSGDETSMTDLVESLGTRLGYEAASYARPVRSSLQTVCVIRYPLRYWPSGWHGRSTNPSRWQVLHLGILSSQDKKKYPKKM